MTACGTVAGYSAHRRAGESTCPSCRQAKLDYQRLRSQAYPPCSVCGKASVAKGLCAAHFRRLQEYGSPTGRPLRATDTFWLRVVAGAIPSFAPHLGPCWIWAGPATTQGYGRINGYGLAHRFAYEHMVGPIPEGLTIDHLCRVQLCVNPEHLDPVPLAVNSQREMAARYAA